MSNTKELDKVLTVNEQDYNINAVHSDTAAKVDHRLIIKESTDAGYTRKEFDGSSDTTLSYVPSSGGSFTGNIKAPTHPTNESISDNSILNRAEISTLVSKLTGTSWYTWDYNKDTGEGQLAGKIDTETNELQKIGIVVSDSIGDDEHAALAEFARMNNSEKWIPFYLYITYRFKTADIQHDDSIGNIYLGTADYNGTVQLTNRLAYNNVGHDSWTAEDLGELEKVLFGIGPEGGIYTYDDSLGSFLERIETLEDTLITLNTHNTLLTTTVQKELADIVNHFGELREFNEKYKDEPDLIKVIRALRDYTEALYLKLTDGSIWVKNAENANNAITAVSATRAGSATKASQDEIGRNISTNYYRTGNNSYKTVENTITVSGSKPNDTAGNDGDIWILI